LTQTRWKSVKRGLKNEHDKDTDKKQDQVYEEQEVDKQDETLTDEVHVSKRALDSIKNSGVCAIMRTTN
jgi:hypothetical protein